MSKKSVQNRSFVSKLFSTRGLIVLLSLILITILAIPALKDLTIPGYFSSHDGVGHLIRMDEFYTAFNDGQIPVRWSKRLYFGYGYPFFNFNYPSVYYFGLPFMMAGFSATLAMEAELAITFVLSGIFMFLYLRRNVTTSFAVLASVLYMYAPYRLLNLYVRGSVAESATFMFPPLLLWSVEAMSNKRPKSILVASLAIFVLGISHNITALLLFAFFLGYALFHSIAKKSVQPFLYSGAALVLGMMMASFFLVPALTEKKLTFLDQTIARDYPDHFVFVQQLLDRKWGFGGSGAGLNDGLSFNMGWMHVALAVVGIGGILVAHGREKIKGTGVVVSFALFGLLLALFFMFPISKIFWDKLPLLPFVQFPWRFLMITVPTLTILAAIGLQHLANHYEWKLPIAATISVVLIAGTLYLAKDEWRINMVEFEQNMTGNALPGTTTWADEQATQWLSPKRKEIPPVQIETSAQSGIQVGVWQTQVHKYLVTVTEPTKVVEHTMYYPGWKLWVNGQEQEINYQDSQNPGEIVFDVPAGTNEVVTRFTETPTRLFFDVLSLLTFIGVVTALLLPRNFLFKRS